MRILWLEHFDRVLRYDRALHSDFAEKLNAVCRVFMYGPKMKQTLPDYCPIEYKKDYSFRELVRSLAIDVVIMDTRSAMYNCYYPQTIYPQLQHKNECWLPEDFATTKIPKVVFEEDYHYELNDKWHKDMGIDLVLQRHYSQSVRKHFLPVKFFPFSVDVDKYKPIEGKLRFPKVCMAGSMIEDIYTYRNRATKELRKHDLVDVFLNQEKVYEKYIEALQHYMFCLSGSSRYDITPAKMFEIMASGSILITNHCMGLRELFPEGTCLVYKDDASDVVDKVEKFMIDTDLREEMIDKAMKCILRSHSHEVRAFELLEILKGVI